eukprot:scpid31571/ scgid32404/ Kinesin-like protein KIF26A
MEISIAEEHLTDLLYDINKDSANTADNQQTQQQQQHHSRQPWRPPLEIRDTMTGGTEVTNLTRVAVPNVEKAGLLLDAALAARDPLITGAAAAHQQMPPVTRGGVQVPQRMPNHFVFTIHLHHMGTSHERERRSKMHFIDLAVSSAVCLVPPQPGMMPSPAANVTMALTSQGNVVLSLMTHAKHAPIRDSKLMKLFKDCLGNTTCRTTVLGHVSSSPSSYAESLTTIQLASRMHRLKRRKNKYAGTSSSGGESSEPDTRPRSRRHPHGAMAGHGAANGSGSTAFYLRQQQQAAAGQELAAIYTSVLSDSEPGFRSSRLSGCDYSTSAAEDSCDTVVYRGTDGELLSEQDLSDGEGPPSHVTLASTLPPSITEVASGKDNEVQQQQVRVQTSEEEVSGDAKAQQGFLAGVPENTSLPTLMEESEMSRASSIDHLEHATTKAGPTAAKAVSAAVPGTKSKPPVATPVKATPEAESSAAPSPVDAGNPSLGVRPPISGQSCSSSDGSEVEKSPGRPSSHESATSPSRPAPPVPKRAVRTPPLGEGSPTVQEHSGKSGQAAHPPDVVQLAGYYSNSSMSSAGVNVSSSPVTSSATQSSASSTQNLTVGICNAIRHSNMSKFGSHHAALAESMPALTSRIAASMSAKNVSMSTQSLGQSTSAVQTPKKDAAPMPVLSNALESLRVSEPLLPEAMQGNPYATASQGRYQYPPSMEQQQQQHQ